MTDAGETKRIKARNLRYKKPMVKNINLMAIREKLADIYEKCADVQWYFGTDDDTLLNALDGNEDEEYEFKMMFCDLCAECEQMQEDLEDYHVPECFDDFFVAAGASEYGGGIQNRYDSLKAAMDILKDENTGQLQTVRRIGECYDRAEKETLGFRHDFGDAAKELDRLTANMPREVWTW